MELKLIQKYFPEISPEQADKFKQLLQLFPDWNDKVNLISRKDIDQLEERHLLHSLGIAKVMSFKAGSRVLDIGTGGGFPGIPLAILFPDTSFHMVDSIGKKIVAVNDMIEQLGLQNASAVHTRAEKVKGSFDFIVSRAVTALPRFIPWTNGKFSKKQRNPLPNGILYLKGGDLTEELKPVKRKIKQYPLKNYFEEAFFETKVVLHVAMT
jgi:16S rRNA (guanine527-N7)-methyltransferase